MSVWLLADSELSFDVTTGNFLQVHFLQGAFLLAAEMLFINKFSAFVVTLSVSCIKSALIEWFPSNYLLHHNYPPSEQTLPSTRSLRLMIRVEIVIKMAHILINMNILSIILFQQWERQSSYSAWLANHASSQPQDFLLLCDRDATWRQVLTSSLCTRSQLHSCHCNHDMRCPGPCSQSSSPHSYLSTQNHHQVSQEHQAYHPIYWYLLFQANCSLLWMS